MSRVEVGDKLPLVVANCLGMAAECNWIYLLGTCP